MPLRFCVLFVLIQQVVHLCERICTVYIYMYVIIYIYIYAIFVYKYMCVCLSV